MSVASLLATGAKVLYFFKVQKKCFKIMTIVSRFFECLELSGIKPYDIEVKFGVKSAQSKISQLKGQKTKGGKDKTLPVDILAALCSANQNINPAYILNGIGSPIIRKQSGTEDLYIEEENNDEDVPEYVYHYTTLKGLAGIISSSCLRFSSFSNSDDLRERELVDDGYNYLCFCTGKSSANKPAMWAKYASNYDGVCIKFNLKRILDINKELKDDIDSFYVKYVPSYFLTTGQDEKCRSRYKNENWAFQNEYRIISSHVKELRIDEQCIDYVVFVKGWGDNIYNQAQDIIKRAGKLNILLKVRCEIIVSEITTEKQIEWDEVVKLMSEIYLNVKDDSVMLDKFMNTMRENGELRAKLESKKEEIERLKKKVATYDQNFVTGVAEVKKDA